MPRVEVFIRVLDDEGSGLAQSSFQIENDVFQLLEANNSPLGMVGELGELFRDTLLRSHSTLGSLTPGDLPVTSSTGEPLRDTLQRRLTPFIRQPANQDTLNAIRQEIGRVMASYPAQIPVLPEVSYSEIENRVLLGFDPGVSMGAHVVAASRTEEDFEGRYQTPAPPEESNPVSRRIRQALRQAVGADPDPSVTSRQAYQDYANGLISRGTFLRVLGLDDVTSQGVSVELQTQDNSRGRIRGRQYEVAILDDAAIFGEELPRIQGGSHISQEIPNRHQAITQSFQEIYGGDAFRSSGLEPTYAGYTTRLPRARPTQGGPEEPTPQKVETPILTRYQRKPVI